jgi:hypothetical protein
MYILFGILALLLIIAGFVGLVGGVVAVFFWALAGICIALLVKTYPRSRKGPNSPTPR